MQISKELNELKISFENRKKFVPFESEISKN